MVIRNSKQNSLNLLQQWNKSDRFYLAAIHTGNFSATIKQYERGKKTHKNKWFFLWRLTATFFVAPEPVFFYH